MKIKKNKNTYICMILNQSCMEELLHYVWKHKIFPLRPLQTTDGRAVEVINPGLHNHDAGPDFFNASVRIAGQLWVGNVEIHLKASDWFRHHHDSDPAYANVILHVVAQADMDVPYPSAGDGRQELIPQLQLEIPASVTDNYDQLVRSDRSPRCADIIPSLPPLMIHSWMSALLAERLELRMQQINERREACSMNWEDSLFITVARTFGFGINGDAFEAWAKSLPMGAVAKHRDSLFQIEALFFGQAGLLDTPPASPSSEEREADEAYLLKLRKEYGYLRHKFGLVPIDGQRWRFHRLRPQNFPHIRIAQLAMLYYEQRVSLSQIVNIKDRDGLATLFKTHVSDFWQTHYTFQSNLSEAVPRSMSPATVSVVLLNAVAPFLFTYGRYKGDEALCEQALELMEGERAEENSIVRTWAEAGIACQSAADSQALIQLTRYYCEPHKCLRCRFGCDFIRRTPGFLKEEESTDPTTL